VWAIVESASGIQVARSPRDLAARSPEVWALVFASRKVPKSRGSCGRMAEHKLGPRDRRVDTRWLGGRRSALLFNSCISGTRGIGG
jgi:hypothetical protein